MWCVSILLVMPLECGEKNAGPPTFQLISKGAVVPDTPLMLTVDEKADLFDRRGTKLSDDDIRGFLQSAEERGHVLRVHLESPKMTSEQLSNLLRRISSFQFRKKLTVYLQLAP